MRLSYLAYTFSLITKYLGIVMLVPIIIAIFYKEYSAIFPFFVSFLILFLFSVLLKTKKTVREIKSINDIKKSDLRRSLGMVLQDVNLFTGTIYDNICYGNHNVSKKEVIKAAKLANAHEFIKMLPNGYDTIITENGSELSQGQKQLISIARAALVNPPVMILDEATSSIDTRTEKIVQDGMDKLMQNRTVFVIAHRLSTIRNANAIMVLEHGEIIERGDHDDLLKQKGRYYELQTGAFELE